MDALYQSDFPNRTDVQAKKTSEVDQQYNCIAWAFGDNTKFLWPGRRAYWPIALCGGDALADFLSWFDHDGWSEAVTDSYDPALTKVALFALGGKPTHAARLLRESVWTSKLGKDIDLQHGRNDLDGPTYGSIFKIFQKSVAAYSSNEPERLS